MRTGRSLKGEHVKRPVWGMSVKPHREKAVGDAAADPKKKQSAGG